jgi:hypothetical protein
VLFESASGYTLFEVVESEEIAKLKAEVQASVTDLARFSKLVKLTAFQPYTSAENALQNINDVSEGIVNEDLKNFLEAQMPKVKPGKTAKFVLGACASLVLPGHGQAGGSRHASRVLRVLQRPVVGSEPATGSGHQRCVSTHTCHLAYAAWHLDAAKRLSTDTPPPSRTSYPTCRLFQV